MSAILAQDVTLIIKLLNSQQFLTPHLDGIDLSSLKNRLQRLRDEADSSQGNGRSPVNLLNDPNSVEDTSLCSFKVSFKDTTHAVKGIKAIRQATGLGLSESKDIWDYGVHSNGVRILTFKNSSRYQYLEFAKQRSHEISVELL